MLPQEEPGEVRPGPGTWRARAHRVIVEADPPAGKAFDVVLIGTIMASVIVVMLDTVREFQTLHGELFRRLEWGFTLLFTLEYGIRIWTVQRPRRYALSFYGIVDLLSVLPTYLSVLIPGGQYLIVIRILRVLRVFRVLKLARYVGEARLLTRALYAARFKISFFLFTVVTIVVVVGALLYMVEGPAAGFTSIPRGMYWAIVTLTTVGYGDIAPRTPVGQAAGRSHHGPGLRDHRRAHGPRHRGAGGGDEAVARVCDFCHAADHDPDAVHCKFCGTPLVE